jgi:hypothetical protein
MTPADQKYWQKAMEEEMKSFYDRDVWVLADLPSGRKSITERWVYLTKSDGHKKAQFIANGFTQTYRIDFEETFSPIAQFKTVRIFLALAALKNWEIKALDVKIALTRSSISQLANL